MDALSCSSIEHRAHPKVLFLPKILDASVIVEDIEKFCLDMANATCFCKAAAFAGASLILTCLRVLDNFHQFQTADDVPKDFFKNHNKIYAFVERIIDGDTIRVRHYPGYSFRRQKREPLQSRGIAHLTLSIRIYGVDTPELAKNKSQKSQPFAEEAKDFASNLLYHKMVAITFLRKDQYSRAVCAVHTLPKFGRMLAWVPGWGSKDVTVELARVGLAELYTGGGAEYFGNREVLERKIGKAQCKKRGIWSLGNARVSAAEEKRRAKNSKSRGEKILDGVITGLEVAAV
jgi:endonuclease YncB( thermonuclease family)